MCGGAENVRVLAFFSVFMRGLLILNGSFLSNRRNGCNKKMLKYDIDNYSFCHKLAHVMRSTIKGRKCKAFGASLDPDQQKFVNEQLHRFAKIVRGFSHYVSILVEYDRQNKVLEKVIPRPFLLPLAPEMAIS